MLRMTETLCYNKYSEKEPVMPFKKGVIDSCSTPTL